LQLDQGHRRHRLSGDYASRILDIVGVVVNRNTIPGDKSAKDPSGIRLGTPWITQRGFDEAKSRKLADVIADVLLACAPHSVDTPHKGRQRRAKLDFKSLNDAKLKIRALALEAGMDFERQHTVTLISIIWTIRWDKLPICPTSA